MSCKLCRSDEYKSFRATVPLKKICVDDNIENEWNVFEIGPRTSDISIICFPPISGNADIFYKQLLALAPSGYRMFSVEYAVHWNCHEFCIGFKKLLDYFNLSKVHLLGASLGGFLAQKFAESYPDTVESLILCNTFFDTNIFDLNKTASSYWLLPVLVLQRIISKNLKSLNPDPGIQDSVEFALESLKSLSQKKLASRLTLNCIESSVKSDAICHLPITILNVADQSALSSNVLCDLMKIYPKAKAVHLESGGNFPYLSRTEEFNKAIFDHLMHYSTQGNVDTT